jgi:hypothetical protein
MTTPVESDGPSRKELERIAFGRADTPAEVAAAEDALRRLVDADEVLAALARPLAAPEPPLTPTPVEARDEANIPTRRHRTLVPLIIVIGLFAGGAIGILVTRSESALSIGGAPATSDTPTPEPTPDPAAALRSLLVPQTKADKGYPLPEGSGPFPIQPASVHRIMTAGDGATLWAARSDSEICLMWTHRSSSDGIEGGMACAAPSEFATRGLSLSEGGTSWTWNGIAFTTTIDR